MIANFFQSLSDHGVESLLIGQQADRAYWRPIIAQLRQLRAAGQLMPEGAAV